MAKDHDAEQPYDEEHTNTAEAEYRIPGVGALTRATRRPSLLEAVPGACGSPAKAVTGERTTTVTDEALNPYWPPSTLIDVNDEDAVYQWAMEASLEDARRRRASQALNGKKTVSAATKRKPNGQHSEQTSKRRKHVIHDDILLDRRRMPKRQLQQPNDDLQLDRWRLRATSERGLPVARMAQNAPT